MAESCCLNCVGGESSVLFERYDINTEYPDQGKEKLVKFKPYTLHVFTFSDCKIL